MIVITSSSAEIIANPKNFLDDMRAGRIINVSDLGYTIAPVALTDADEIDDESEHMVSLRTDLTGVDNTVFVSTKGYDRHAPRIKIAVDPPHSFNATAKTASMAIHDYGIKGEYVAPQIAEQAKRFIERNRKALLDYWECNIDTATLIKQLKPPS